MISLYHFETLQVVDSNPGDMREFWSIIVVDNDEILKCSYFTSNYKLIFPTFSIRAPIVIRYCKEVHGTLMQFNSFEQFLEYHITAHFTEML